MISIELNDLQLYAYHGVDVGEDKTGNPYQVNLIVSFNEGSETFDNLESTINYVTLYKLVKQRMSVPTPLLEKVAESIIRRIKHEFAFVNEIRISIYKLQVPIEQFRGKVGVTLHKKF